MQNYLAEKEKKNQDENNENSFLDSAVNSRRRNKKHNGVKDPTPGMKKLMKISNLQK